MNMFKRKKTLSFLMVLVLIFPQLGGLVFPASAAMPAFSDTSITDDFFYIENADVGKFMQMDNDDDPNYNTIGAIMELWDYDGRDMQRWRIIARGSGYYQIANVQSGLSLAVQEGYENSSGRALVQETYTGNARQWWTITKTSRGTYVIRPFSGENYSTDWCMCAGTQFLGFTDGLNVEQKGYSNDNALKDEWILHQVYDVSLLGLDEYPDVDRSEYFANTQNCFASIGRDSIHTEYFTDYTVEDMIECMQRSIVFYIHTHGNWDRIGITIPGSGGVLTMEDLEGVDLTQLDFALLLTCDTATGGYSAARVAANTPANFLEQLICCGVETAIGFKGRTYYYECNWLAESFTNFWVNGDGSSICGVEDALEACSRDLIYCQILCLAEVGGDGAKTIS